MYKLVRCQLDGKAIQVKTWKSHPSTFRIREFAKHWLPSVTSSYHLCFINLKIELSDKEIIEEINKAISNNFKKPKESKFTSIVFYSLQND